MSSPRANGLNENGGAVLPVPQREPIYTQEEVNSLIKALKDKQDGRFEKQLEKKKYFRWDFDAAKKRKGIITIANILPNKKPDELRSIIKSDNQYYAVLEEIDSGGYGKVKRAQNIVTQELVVIKLQETFVIPSARDSLNKLRQRVIKEMEVLKTLKKGKQTKILERDITALVHTIKQFILIMDFYDGPSLSTLLKQKRKYNSKEALTMVSSGFLELKLFHENQYIHADLKPGNLIKLKNNQVKIVDCGSTVTVGEKCDSITTLYLAPELRDGKNNPTFKSDVYSLSLAFAATFDFVTIKGNIIPELSWNSPPSGIIMKKLYHLLKQQIDLPPEKRLDVDQFLGALTEIQLLADLEIMMNELKSSQEFYFIAHCQELMTLLDNQASDNKNISDYLHSFRKFINHNTDENLEELADSIKMLRCSASDFPPLKNIMNIAKSFHLQQACPEAAEVFNILLSSEGRLGLEKFGVLLGLINDIVEFKTKDSFNELFEFLKANDQIKNNCRFLYNKLLDLMSTLIDKKMTSCKSKKISNNFENEITEIFSALDECRGAISSNKRNTMLERIKLLAVYESTEVLANIANPNSVNIDINTSIKNVSSAVKELQTVASVPVLEKLKEFARKIVPFVSSVLKINYPFSSLIFSVFSDNSFFGKSKKELSDKVMSKTTQLEEKSKKTLSNKTY